MGRTLPWKPAGRLSTTKPPTCLHPTTTASPPPGTSPSRPKPAAPSARPSLVSGPVPPRSPAPRPGHSRTDGSASSPSTPLRPSGGPLPESFMVEGFDNDDRWRMVEDEFYSVAARFTAHLHVAQYRRLKNEAKQNPTIQTVARPVTRPQALDVVRRQAPSTLAASQRRVIATAKLHYKASASAAAAAAAAQPDDEDSGRLQIPPHRKRTHLASLMDSPRKRAQPLTGIATSQGKALAAAMSSSSKPRSIGIRTGTSSTPSDRPMSFATGHEISNSAAKTTHARDGPCGILEPAAARGGLTSEPAHSHSDHDSDMDDLGQHSARSHGTMRTNHLAVVASWKPVTSNISAPAPAPQKPMPTDHASQSPAPQSAEANDDSDSGSETYFQRRLRARRSRPKPLRGQTPNSGRTEWE